MGCVVTAGVGQVITSYLPLPFPSAAKLSVHNTMSLQGSLSCAGLWCSPSCQQGTTPPLSAPPANESAQHILQNAGPGAGEAGVLGEGPPSSAGCAALNSACLICDAADSGASEAGSAGRRATYLSGLHHSQQGLRVGHESGHAGRAERTAGRARNSGRWRHGEHEQHPPLPAWRPKGPPHGPQPGKPCTSCVFLLIEGWLPDSWRLCGMEA